MKKIILLVLILSCSPALDARQILVNIDDDEIAIVENDVLDSMDWLTQAWQGKVANCKSRIVEAEIARCRREGKQIPVSDDDIVKQAMARPDYKNRKQRDAEQALRDAAELEQFKKLQKKSRRK